MKTSLWISLLFVCNNLLAGQPPVQHYSQIKTDRYVQSKNYYLLTLFQQLPDLNKLLSDDKELLTMAVAKRNYLSSSLKNCGTIGSCYLEKIKFSLAEIENIGKRLKDLYTYHNELKVLVQNHLIPSGCYSMFEDLSPQEMLEKAWEQDAGAINYALEVYAEGKSPNYPKIDSISFNVNFKLYPSLLYDCTNTVLEEVKNERLFFMPTMDYALQAIEINDRNRASDYEPMESTCNKAAFDRVNTINWSDFAYTLILVPGAGPEDREEPLSATGKLRCRVAACRWEEGIAPFIMVSGGKVHPYKTKYCEAEEMKKYLTGTMNIPESAIIIEPHARHTSTNMRNCARIVFRYSMPMDKPCITSTTKSQSFYITNEVMQQRCIKELGYTPYRNGNRLSETEAEFYPLVTSLQIDADEPMDP
ncbi:MAG: YdcF family protein [Mariniphaga sp.]|nr:YdcF family protein [Mariniphaga sp.]